MRKQAKLPAIHNVTTNFAKTSLREGISTPSPDKVMPIVVGLEKPQSAYVAIVSALLWWKKYSQSSINKSRCWPLDINNFVWSPRVFTYNVMNQLLFSTYVNLLILSWMFYSHSEKNDMVKITDTLLALMYVPSLSYPTNSLMMVFSPTTSPITRQSDHGTPIRKTKGIRTKDTIT